MAKKDSSPSGAVAGITGRGPVIVKADVQERLISYVNTIMDCFPFEDLRNRFERIDKAYAIEKYKTPTEEDMIANDFRYNVPIVKPDTDAVADWLITTFLSGNQLFTAVASASFDAQRRQLQAVIDENSKETAWGENLALCFRDGAKYNVLAMEVNWATRGIYKSMQVDVEGKTENQQVLRAGNEIKHLNPYNTYYDINVPLSEVCTKGDFAGYVQRLTVVQLYQLIADLKTAGVNVMNETDAMWASRPARQHYYEPTINSVDKVRTSGWDNFFGFNMGTDTLPHSNLYEVNTVYLRIVPKLLGLKVPADDTVQVWKFIIVNNNYIIYADHQNDAHGMLNIVVGQPVADGLNLQTKSVAENLMPLQNLSSELHELRLASLYRGIGDRGIYDPRLVQKKDIDSKNPRYKIPLKPTAMDKTPKDAYYPIPYNDNTAAQIYQEIQMVRQHANEISGSNNATRGQFQKGNKTKFEYMDVMSNSTNTQVVIGLLLEYQVFNKLKRMIMMNVLQYQQAQEGIDPKTNQPVSINPAELRQAVLTFKLADGIADVKSIVNIEALKEAFMFMAQSPEFQVKYDTGKIFAYVMGMSNADLQDFERPPQEQQAALARTQGNANAAQPGGDVNNPAAPSQGGPVQ